jgi:uncharacterized protein YoaH (UPF0181 family)
MSVVRSRSGGIDSVNVLIRKKRSVRSFLSASAASRSVFDRFELALLQHSQQLGLQRGRHLANLIEQQRAAVGKLQDAGAIGQRPGERSALVTEQLRLHQLRRNRRAVHLHERRVRALAVPVNRVGHQLLARAVLSLDQHAGVARRNLADEREQLLHLVAARHHVGERGVILQLDPHAAVLRRHHHLLFCLLEHREQQHRVDRLFDEPERAGVHRLDDFGHAAVAGDHHDLRVWRLRAQIAQQVQVVNVWEHEVEQHDVRFPRRHLHPAFVAGASESHVEPARLQQKLERGRGVWLVIDDQHTHRGRSGHASSKYYLH